jgi:RimJ/RimL family protein N-acetyltransferase
MADHRDEAFTVSSARLDLVLLSPEFLAAVVARDIDRAQRVQPFALPAGWLDSSATKYLDLRLAQIRDDPSATPWLVRLLVRRADAQVVGHITFHAPPDRAGRAEIGYTVCEPYRRQGYATEAARAMMAWATARGAHRFVLSISPANEPSLALADRMGFTRTGRRSTRSTARSGCSSSMPAHWLDHDPFIVQRRRIAADGAAPVWG